MEWSLDYSEVTELFQRLEEKWKSIPTIEVGPDEADEIKAVMAMKRGDALYPLTSEMESTVRDGFYEAMMGDQDIAEIGQDFLEQVRHNILAGMVEGPPRSDKWVKRKGDDVNMVGLTGQFVARLQVRFLNRAGGFTRDLSSGRFVRA